jgi:hypothetical protein
MTTTGYTKRVVAFLDCLSFRNLIQESVTNAEVFQRIHSMQTIISKQTIVASPGSVDFKFCQFSDSIIISADDSITGIWTILLGCRAFYHHILGHGIFLRGGISGIMAQTP